MSKRDVRLFLHDMLEAIDNVERYTAGLSFAQFESNDMVVDAVIRNLEVIGEAAKYIPLTDSPTSLIMFNKFINLASRRIWWSERSEQPNCASA